MEGSVAPILLHVHIGTTALIHGVILIADQNPLKYFINLKKIVKQLITVCLFEAGISNKQKD